MGYTPIALLFYGGINIQKLDRTGEINFKKDGSKMEIIRYGSSADIDVLFDNGYVAKNIPYNYFKVGKIKNPYHPSIYGVAFFGESNVKANRHCYEAWSGVLERCYDVNYQKKQPSYKDCKLDDSWHNYQNFSRWYDENFYKVSDDEMALDKDILVKGNKLYSPETCVFVPQRLNKLFIGYDKKNKKGTLPLGVCIHGKRFKSQCSASENGVRKNIHLGIFDTAHEAHEAYKTYKKSLINETAEKYKSQIPDKLYQALINYEV